MTLVGWSSQDVTEPGNMSLSNGTEDVQPAGPPVELFIEHEIGPVHPSDGCEIAGLEAMDAQGEGPTEWTCLCAIQ